jgi:zinc transport system substrate-binding protein
MMRTVVFLGLMAVVALSTSPVAAEGTDRLTVYTVNYPLQYFAQRIAGEHAEVVFPAPGGVDPAFWQPSAEDIAAYQRADLILLNGAGYAKWTNRVSLPRRRLVDTSAAFRDRTIQVDSGVTHSHGPKGDHSHAGTAFTTWLDPTLAVEQARAIAEALVRMRPEQQAKFNDNLAVLQQDLLALDGRLQAIVAADPDQRFIASHPVYQYLQRRYRLDLQSLMWEPDQDPGEAEWVALGARLTERPVGWMIWEGEPVAASVARLQAMGVQSLVFEPVANRPQQGDFLSVMTRNVERLLLAFR